jgi:hypothetical protein
MTSWRRPCEAYIRMRAEAASSQVGSAFRQPCHAATTSSGRDRPAPRIRSRARARRASWRRYSRCSRARTAQSALGSSSSGTPRIESAATRAASRSLPGANPRAARSACSAPSRSTSNVRSVAAQTWLRSVHSRRAPAPPRSPSTERAMERALDSALEAASGPRAGNSASQAAPRLLRRPGVTSTSWHSRRAVGRGHAPARRPATEIANDPRRRTSTRSPPPWSFGEAGIQPCSHHEIELSPPLSGPTRRPSPCTAAPPASTLLLSARRSARPPGRCRKVDVERASTSRRLRTSWCTRPCPAPSCPKLRRAGSPDYA